MLSKGVVAADAGQRQQLAETIQAPLTFLSSSGDVAEVVSARKLAASESQVLRSLEAHHSHGESQRVPKIEPSLRAVSYTVHMAYCLW